MSGMFYLSNILKDSTNALFLRIILSYIGISMFFMLLLILVNNCTPSRNRKSKSLLSMYPLSPHSFPQTFSTKEAFSMAPGRQCWQALSWSWATLLYRWWWCGAWSRRTILKQILFYEDGQMKQYWLLQFYKTVIGDNIRKKMPQMHAYILPVEMFEAAETVWMEDDQNGHHFWMRQSAGFVLMLFAIL